MPLALGLGLSNARGDLGAAAGTGALTTTTYDGPYSGTVDYSGKTVSVVRSWGPGGDGNGSGGGGGCGYAEAVPTAQTGLSLAIAVGLSGDNTTVVCTQSGNTKLDIFAATGTYDGSGVGGVGTVNVGSSPVTHTGGNGDANAGGGGGGGAGKTGDGGNAADNTGGTGGAGGGGDGGNGANGGTGQNGHAPGGGGGSGGGLGFQGTGAPGRVEVVWHT